MVEKGKDETATYERWLASRNLRGSVVLAGGRLPEVRGALEPKGGR